MNAQFQRFLFVVLLWAGIFTSHLVVSPYVLGGVIFMSALVLFELWRSLGVDTRRVKKAYLEKESSFLNFKSDD